MTRAVHVNEEAHERRVRGEVAMSSKPEATEPSNLAIIAPYGAFALNALITFSAIFSWFAAPVAITLAVLAVSIGVMQIVIVVRSSALLEIWQLVRFVCAGSLFLGVLPAVIFIIVGVS